MKDFTKENEETAQPPEPQGVEAPEPEFLEDEEQEEPVQWDGSDAEIVSEGADQEYKDTITGVKLSYVLTEEEIRTCMRGTQFGKRRKRRMRIELVVFSALLLGFLVFFFLKRNPDNLFFATVCAAMIFIMIFLPDIRIKQDAKRNANGKEICMEIYPHKIEMGRGENQWEIPLDGSCKSAIYQKNIVVYFKGDDMVILPMRCVEPSVLPEVRGDDPGGHAAAGGLTGRRTALCQRFTRGNPSRWCTRRSPRRNMRRRPCLRKATARFGAAEGCARRRR